MPRISEAARQARRTQILDAARACFLERGFHQTSMDDILTRAKLSAGGAYRYFSGKDEIIAAIAHENVSSLTAAIDAMAVPEPPPTLAETIPRLVALADQMADGPGKLALMVWGEAQTDPTIAALIQTEAPRVRAAVQELVRRANPEPVASGKVTVENLGNIIASLVPGYILQRRILGGVDPDTYAATIVALLAPAD